MPKRRKAAAAAVASQSPRQSPRASVKASAMPSPATTSRSSRSRSTSVSSKGEKTSPVPSPAPTSRGGRSRSRSAKEAEPVEETQTPRGRSNKRGAAAKASPSPKGSARLTRAVVQDEEKKGSASKDTKAGGRGRSRGRGKKTEEEEVPEEEEEVEEEAEVEEVESPKAKASAKKKPPAKKTPAKATSEKATPARSGRSRSRQTKPEPEPEEEEEAEDEEESKTQEEDSQTSSGSGRRSSRGRTTEVKTPPKKATPRNRRGQSKAEVSPETTEETMEEGEQKAKAEASPKGRSRRAAKSPAAKVTPPPQSRSRRSRGKQEPEKEEVPEKEEEPEKAEPEVEEIEEPEKVEEPEKEEPMKDEVPEKMEIPEKEEEPKVETAEDVDSAEKPDEKAEEMEQETEVPEEEAEQPELAEQATIEEETRQDKPDEAPVEDAEEPEDVEGSAPSGIETPPEEPAPPAEAPPVAVVSDDSVEEEVMEVEAEPAVVKAAELRQPVAEAVMEAEVAAAPVTADGLEQLSPPADEGESAAVENASQESAEATVPDAQAPAAEPHAAPYYPEVVTLSPDVPEQDVESVSPPPKSPEIISLNSPVAEESEISETVPSVTVDAATAAPEVISISPPPEPANSEPEVISVPDEVISVPDEVNNSAPTATTICEPITIEDEPVLSSRKRSHEEVEEADEEDLSSKKAKVVDLTEQEDAFDCQVTQVTLANGSQESPEKSKPATQEMEPDIVETVSEPMEVGQARGEGDYTAALSEVAVEAVNTVPESQNTCNSASSTEEDILKEYVVIEMSDVPGASTGEVQQAANRAQPSTDNHVSQTLPPSDKDPLFNRLFVSNHNVPSDSLVPQKQFAVVSYNILAECWMRRFADAYSYATPELFETRFRHTRIIEELRYLNADVVCLQEVDQKYFENTLLPEMTSLGYGGTFKSRMADEGFMEGEAIFYKNSRFTLLQTEGKYLKELADKEIESSPLTEDVRACVRKYLDLPDVVVVANLQCKVTGSIVAVGNVHVNYGNFEKPNAQCVQIACAIKELVSRANNGNTPHIICGDFNTPPDSPGYQLARDGYLSDDMIQKLQSSNNLEMPDGSKNSLVNHLWKGFQHTSSTLKSAYATVQEVEPSMTSLVGDVIKHCLDYIFYSSDSLDTVGVLQVASVADISANVGLPSQVFPSDHLSMKAVLSFK